MPVAIEGLTQAAAIEVAGSPIAAALYAQLAEVRVELGFGAAGWFQLRFSTEDPLDPSFRIGAPIRISFDDRGGELVEVFDGTVDSLAVEYDQGRRLRLVSGYDARRKLGSAPKVRAFTNQSHRDILAKIAQESGLTSDIDSGATQPVFEHVLQAGSDIAFVAEICRRLGMEWFVDGTKLVVRPRTGGRSVPLAFGDQLRRFNARYTATEHPATVTVHGWDPASKQSLVAHESQQQSHPVGSIEVERAARSIAADGRTAASWARPIASLEHGEALARGYARTMSSDDLLGRGEIDGDPTIVPGVLCDITGIDENWNGTYYVTGAEHVYRGGEPYLTRFTVGGYESSSIVDLMGAGAGTRTATGFGSGVTIGVVTNNRNADGDHGHVKVKFPYLDDSVESGWARLATIGAGNDRGLMFVPEVNDEVLVAFEHGDPARPYVIGALWNGKDRPPLKRDGHDVDKRTIVSRAGHRLTFHDGEGDDELNVTVELADGATKLFLGQDKVEVIANAGKPVEVRNDKARVVLSGAGDLRLEAENITIAAKRDLKLEGTKIETSSKADTKFAAGAGLQTSSNAPTKIESSAILELKGVMVKVN